MLSYGVKRSVHTLYDARHPPSFLPLPFPLVQSSRNLPYELLSRREIGTLESCPVPSGFTHWDVSYGTGEPRN